MPRFTDPSKNESDPTLAVSLSFSKDGRVTLHATDTAGTSWNLLELNASGELRLYGGIGGVSTGLKLDAHGRLITYHA